MPDCDPSILQHSQPCNASRRLTLCGRTVCLIRAYYLGLLCLCPQVPLTRPNSGSCAIGSGLPSEATADRRGGRCGDEGRKACSKPGGQARLSHPPTCSQVSKLATRAFTRLTQTARQFSTKMSDYTVRTSTLLTHTNSPEAVGGRLSFHVPRPVLMMKSYLCTCRPDWLGQHPR